MKKASTDVAGNDQLIEKISANHGVQIPVRADLKGGGKKSSRREEDDLLLEKGVAEDASLEPATESGEYAASGVLQLAQADMVKSTGSVSSDTAAADADMGGSANPAGAADTNVSTGIHWGNILLGSLAVGGLAAAAGGGGGGGGGGVVAVAANVVTGVVTAGPVIPGHGLSVQLYKAEGITTIGEPVQVGLDGRFTISVGAHTGAVIARVFNSGVGSDYNDEATGLDVDLSAALMAVGNMQNGTTLVLNISPLTAIAAQIAGLNPDGTGAVAGPDVVATVNAANASVAKVFGLSDVTTIAPNLTNDSLAGSNDIGKLLAALSGMDAVGSTQETINNLKDAITGSGSVAILSSQAQAMVLLGAAVAERSDASGADASGLVYSISNLLSHAASATGYSINDLANDNVIKLGELTVGGTITGTVKAGTLAESLSIFYGDFMGTGNFVVDGTSWTYTLSAGDVDTINASTDGVNEVKLIVAGDEKASRLVLTDMEDSAPVAVTLMNGVTALFENTNLSDGKKVADIVIADSDGYLGGVPTVSNSNFEVKNVNGKYELWIKSSTSIDYETVAEQSLSTTVTAGGVTSRVFVVELINVNEAPTGANQTFDIDEDGSHSFTEADFSFADAVGENGSLSAVIITTLPIAGSLKLNDVAVTAGQLIAVGDLPNLSFVPEANANGSGYATIGFKVVDNGGTANGGVNISVNAYNLTFNVAAVNDAPVLSSVNPIVITDTAEYDTFSNQIGALVATDVDGDSLTFGIQGGVTGGSFSVGDITYDVSKVGTYGTLYVVSAGANEGKYLFAPNDIAINSLSDATSEDYIFTVADASLSHTQTLKVNLAGANDRPQLVTGFITDGTPSVGDDDYLTLVVGSSSNLTFATAFADPDTGASPPSFELVSIDGAATGTIPGLTFNSNGTISGMPTIVEDGSYPVDYTVVVRAKDAANPALYTDHAFVLHMLKAPVVQSFTVADSTDNPTLGKSGDLLTFSVVFSESVTVTGTPQINFTIGATTVTASYDGGSGGATLSFIANAPTGEATSITLTSIDLNSGTVIGNTSNQGWTTTVVSQTAGYTLDNTPPVVEASYNVTENTESDTETKSINLLATDSNGPITWSTSLSGVDADKFVLDSAGTLTFNAATNFEAKDDAGADGVYDVIVTAIDAAGNTREQAITVNLQNVNEAPTVANPIADQSFVMGGVGNTFTFASNVFADVDVPTTLTYSATLSNGSPLPDWLSFDAATRTFSGNPTSAGTTTVRVSASDGSLSVSDEFIITSMEAPSLSTTLEGVANFDVRSIIVLSVGESVIAKDGGTITLTDLGGAGYRGEDVNNSQSFSVTDTARVTITGSGADTKIIINPAFDLDLGSNYSLAVSTGAFSGVTTGQDSQAFSTVNFGTVNPGAGFASSVQAQSMNAITGEMENSLKWFDATGIGSPTGAQVTLDFDTGDYAAVVKGVKLTSGASADTVLEGAGHMLLKNFGVNDLLYVDNQDNTNIAAQDSLNANVFSGGLGSVSDPFQMAVEGTDAVNGGAYFINFAIESGITLPILQYDFLLPTVNSNNWSATGIVIAA